MNDNQIMQALEICRTDTTCCTCPYYSMKAANCMAELTSDALELIKKQKEEINELAGKHYNECGQIAKYSDELNQFTDIGKMYSEIKAEIIKEFADALKSKSKIVPPNIYVIPYRAVAVEDIDNLVNEMTGGEENESK